MDPSFEWDPDKASGNLTKHGVSFAEAQTVFLDPLALDAPDPDHSWNEGRSLVVGRSFQGRLLVVAYTERRATIRIISAREATRGERRAYEHGS